jgi:hypothetical protein
MLLVAVQRRAHAKGLTREELLRLNRGEVVKREVTVDLPSGQYTGGVSYVIVQAPAEDVMKALVDSSAIKSLLPMVLEARELERRGGDWFVFLRHGGRLGSAAFTVRVRRASPYSVQFWLDPSRPHEIDDMWGSFRVKPIDEKRSLFTYSALLRLPFGIMLLFEDKIRSIALNTPARVRRYVEGRGTTAQLPGR